MKHWRVGLLGASISLLAVYIIYRQIDQQLDRQQLQLALQTARYMYIFPCVVLLLAGLVTRALRWRMLLGGDLPLPRAFSIMNVGYMVNNMFQRVGEVVRVFMATRGQPSVPVMKTTSTIIAEKLLDTLAALSLVGIAFAFGPLPVQFRQAALLIGPILFVGFVVLVTMAGRRAWVLKIVSAIVERFPTLQRLNPVKLATHFLDGLAPLASLGTFIAALFWTAASWAFSAAAGYVLMYTFFEQASWAATCLYIAAAAIAIAVPAAPANIGTYEFAILYALDATGYNALGENIAIATMFAVLVHVINFVVHVITGIFGLVHEQITVEQLSQGVRRLQDVNANEVIENGLSS